MNESWHRSFILLITELLLADELKGVLGGKSFGCLLIFSGTLKRQMVSGSRITTAFFARVEL